MIKNVWIDESKDECVVCGACEATCDAIFRVEKKVKVVGSDFVEYDKEIREAADICPAEVIKFSEEDREETPCKPMDFDKVLEKANMVEKSNDDVAEDGTGYIVTKALNFIKPKPFYTLDVLNNMRTQSLTFEFAASVIHHMFPDNQVFLGGYRYSDDLSDCTKLDEVKLVRARWRKPSNKMHWASPYDIEIDRQQIKYIMYIQDIRNKYVKTKRMKVVLEDLDVGDFMDFVRAQQKIVQNNLSKKKRR